MLLLLLAEEGTIVHKHHGKAQSRLALYVLNQLNLVPEHVETRALYNKTQQPTMEQVSLSLRENELVCQVITELLIDLVTPSNPKIEERLLRALNFKAHYRGLHCRHVGAKTKENLLTLFA